MHDLRNLMEKYEEMAKRIGTSLSVDHLLNSMDLPYSLGITMVSFPPKFKFLQIKLYIESKDPV